MEYAQIARSFTKFGTFGKIFQDFSRNSKIFQNARFGGESCVLERSNFSTFWKKFEHCSTKWVFHFRFVIPPHFGILNHRCTTDADFLCRRPNGYFTRDLCVMRITGIPCRPPPPCRWNVVYSHTLRWDVPPKCVPRQNPILSHLLKCVPPKWVFCTFQN